jgi:flagellin
VGLLDVADGALSQVTNLLDRAITLATEASNGTLNSTQEAAANQEYQSILAEINNIGSTTTYNQEQVFQRQPMLQSIPATLRTAGSSLDDLNIRALSSSNRGRLQYRPAPSTMGLSFTPRPSTAARQQPCSGSTTSLRLL